MARIHIDKLIIDGPSGPSEIEFGEHLTVIVGRSNCGKSMIFNSISYVLGGDTVPEKLKSTKDKYNSIELLLAINGTRLSAKRVLEANDILLTNLTDGNHQPEPIQCKKFSKMLLGYLGLDGIKVPSNLSATRKNVTWGIVKNLFMYKELKTELEEPIIYSNQYNQDTQILSTLLYCLYMTDFSSIKESDKPEARKAKKGILTTYIEKSKAAIETDREKDAERLKKLQEALGKERITTDDILESLSAELDEIDKKMAEASASLTAISKDIYAHNDRIMVLNQDMERYSELMSDYMSDIDRLNLIVSGKETEPSSTVTPHCPFCNSEMLIPADETSIQTAKSELSRIVGKFNDLKTVVDEVNAELDAQTKAKDALYKRRKEISLSMSSDLRPARYKLQQQISAFQSMNDLQTKIAAYDEQLATLTENKTNVDKFLDTPTEYRPLEKFDSDFESSMSESILRILQAIQYSPLEDACFKISDFDMHLNGEPKKANGKGTRSLLNSVVLLAFREYLNAKAKIYPGFFMIDSPLHGFSVGEVNDTENVVNIRKMFFKYLFEHCNSDDQLIILENANNGEVNESDYAGTSAKIIKFSKEDGERYGLLKDII